MTKETLEINGNRCIVCGLRKWEEGAEAEEPLCEWCQDALLLSVLDETIDQAQTEIETVSLLDCDSSALLSFISDIGMLGTQHNFLASFRDILGVLVRQVAGEGRAHLSDLWTTSRLRHVYSFLRLLVQLGLVEINDEDETIEPSSPIFDKIAATTEVDSRLNRASTFLLGYVTLKGISNTLHTIRDNGRLLYGEGITNLYPITRDERILILKGYTAPISFIFGTWARGLNEFSDRLLNEFLANRGLTGKSFVQIKNWLTQDRPGSVLAVYSFNVLKGIDGFPVYQFRLNPEYGRIRENILERIRKRSRERTSNAG